MNANDSVDRRGRRLRVGLALGGGAARGWAHIGVIRALADLGVHPDVVAGTSVGAIVGAFHAGDRLEAFEDWVRRLTRRDILSYMDLALGGGGGFIEGKRLAGTFLSNFGDVCFDDLRLPLGVVATELYTGHERWIREGSVVEALRASVALPGLFTPARVNGEWLVDGGLVNPVPVSLCHAMGADIVVAVNLNGDMVGRHLPPAAKSAGSNADNSESEADAESWLDRLSGGLKERAGVLLDQFRGRQEAPSPGLFDVLATAINIMQDRITRSRMAGDPPDLVIAPRLARIGLMEFDRAGEAIEEGLRAVGRMESAVKDLRRMLGEGNAE
ncbi:MAG: patatin-like phospholipase family protein [Ectothiorhodospiraceae bacterium]